MEERRNGRDFAERPPRRNSSRSPRGLVLREGHNARQRRDRGGGGRRATYASRSRSTGIRNGGDRDSRRGRPQSPEPLKRRRENLPQETRNGARSRSPPSSGSPSPSPAMASIRKKRAGFDQKEMLPENYAMQQLTAMLPKGQPVLSVPKFNPRRIWDTLPTTVTHVNPEVETFLLHNPVELHAATRLRALPPHFQSIVLERGGIFGSRDKTAVLMSRIKDVCRGVTDPYAFLYKPGQDLSGIPATSSTSAPVSNPTLQQAPGSNETALALSQPAARNGFSGVMSTSSGGLIQERLDQQTHEKEAEQEAKRQRRAAREAEQEAREESKKAEREAKEAAKKAEREAKEAATKHEQVVQAGAEMIDTHSRNRQGSGLPASNGLFVPTKLKRKKLDEAPANEPENALQKQKREEMQSSIAATLASLKEKVLGKDKGQLAGGPDTAESKSLDKPSDQDTGMAPALPSAQTRVSAPALPNPFRSKPHAAPVSTNLLEDSADATESPLLKNAFNQTPIEGHAGLSGTVEAPSQNSQSEQLESEVAVPATDQMEAAKIPLGLRALRLQKGSAAAGSGLPTQIELQAGQATAALATQEEKHEEKSTPSVASISEAMFAASEQAVKAVSAPETFEEKKQRVHATANRAYALATLINYGLTDPDNEADLSKAVHAMSQATGDHKMAVAMWQQVTGKEPVQPIQSITDGSSASGAVQNLPDAVQNLPEQQQSELQQAAAAAQYSQLWMQQQFLSQMTLFENQWHGAPSGEVPTASEGSSEVLQVGGKGKGKSDGEKKNAWQMMLPGDWKCPGCGDHQFARNRVCRYCGTAKPC